MQEDDGSGREQLGDPVDDHAYTWSRGVEYVTVPSAEAIPQLAESRCEPGTLDPVWRAEEFDGVPARGVLHSSLCSADLSSNG
jgi:hypothetical protein